jgi:hypothetical protein
MYPPLGGPWFKATALSGSQIQAPALPWVVTELLSISNLMHGNGQDELLLETVVETAL